MTKLNRAKEFAKLKHGNSLRRDGKTPYWHHLRLVVANLQKLGITDTSVLCAGWLHDTIEDTATDYEDIYKRFGRKCADIVSVLTKETRLPEPKREKLYAVQLAKSTWHAKAVKLCDVLSNISDLENSGYPKKSRKQKVREKMIYLRAIRPGISANKSNMPGLDKIESELNALLVQYGQKQVFF
ncbi:MAG: HD domain-containing protein [Candidatus Nitrosotenuis sp.]|jgi:guanosine-3',5'-bis(diphosphate) 3'-pyrophosphohydrolase